MAGYWLRENERGPVRGPVSAAALKAMAQQGQLPPAALISQDQVKWYPAGRVKGLFTDGATASPPGPAVVSGPTAEPPAIPIVAELVAEGDVSPAAHAAWAGEQRLSTGRRVPWVMICVVGSAAMLLLMVVGGWVVYTVVRPAMQQAREMAHRARCAANMRAIGMGLSQYAARHGGRDPETLEQAVASGDVTAEQLICPASGDTAAPGSTPAEQAAAVRAGGHCSYVYTAARLHAGSPASAVVLYEAVAAHQGAGANILTRDGAVKFYAPDAAQNIIRQVQASLSAAKEPLRHVGKPVAQPQPALEAGAGPAPSAGPPPALQASVRPAPAAAPAALDAARAGLLAAVDLAGGWHTGHWRVENNALRSSGHGTEILGVPGALPAEFDLRLDFTRISGQDEIGVALLAGGSHVAFTAGAAHNTRMGIELFGRDRHAVSASAVKRTNIVAVDTPHQLLIRVRKGSFDATLDGTLNYRLDNPDYAKMTLPLSWKSASQGSLALLCRGSEVEFRQLRLQPAP